MTTKAVNGLISATIALRGSANRDDPVCVGEAAEPWPERPAAKRQERENGSTSVETTCHL
jgi:hypothetical protein